VGSPYSAEELQVFPYVADTVKKLKAQGFKVIVISNQPGVGKGQFELAELERMNAKIRKQLTDAGTSFDGEYYCMHHPSALIAKYRVNCDCRKPKPGLLLRAAEEHGINLWESYFVGDALIDVKAGKRAGCRTVLVGHLTTFLTDMMEQEDATPDFMLPSLKAVPEFLSEGGPDRDERRGSKDARAKRRPAYT
jgi:histidinol-phosphate phosphatase family protein